MTGRHCACHGLACGPPASASLTRPASRANCHQQITHLREPEPASCRIVPRTHGQDAAMVAVRRSPREGLRRREAGRATRRPGTSRGTCSASQDGSPLNLEGRGAPPGAQLPSGRRQRAVLGAGRCLDVIQDGQVRISEVPARFERQEPRSSACGISQAPGRCVIRFRRTTIGDWRRPMETSAGTVPGCAVSDAPSGGLSRRSGTRNRQSCRLAADARQSCPACSLQRPGARWSEAAERADRRCGGRRATFLMARGTGHDKTVVPRDALECCVTHWACVR